MSNIQQKLSTESNLIGINRTRYSTFRSLGTLLDNYAKIATLPILPEKVSMSIVLNIQGSTGKYDEVREFTCKLYFDNNNPTPVLITNEDTTLFTLVGDLKSNGFDVYIKSTKPGATYLIDTKYGINAGFIELYDKEEFIFEESLFTKKVLPSITNSVKTNDLSIDGNSTAKSINIKRTKSDGTYNKTMIYTGSDGSAVFSKNKTNSDTIGNYDTALLLGETNIVSSGNLVPSKDNGFSIGETSKKFTTGYFNSGVVVKRTDEPTTVYNGMLYVLEVGGEVKLRYHSNGKKYSVKLTQE